MCGIAGIVDLESRPVEPGILIAMNQALAHRGPDDEGYVLINAEGGRYQPYAGPFSSAEVKGRFPGLRSDGCLPGSTIGLSQRRFSIIDLSSNGHQPFIAADGGCCIVFNGEIYNYLEIREELASQGYTFASNSDTEVLLLAYRHWGTGCFSRLNGFWALALYDFQNRRLVVSRDRVGKKPLYWTKVGQRVYFASEIKALLQVPEIHRNRKVNEQAVRHWLAYGQKDLNWNTCFEGIRTLPAASWAVIDGSFPDNVNRFWCLPSERLKEIDISTTEAAKQLRALLEDAVNIRLRADVPLSVELSGGLDSSTLVALAARSQPGPITTYTVRFPQDKYNEEPFARSVAVHYKTEYRILESPTNNFWTQILPFTYLEEEPYHSPNLHTNQMIWSQMRGNGTKVSLNGAGGDENFAGYSAYYIPAQLENLMYGRFGTYLTNTLRYSQGRTNIRSAVKTIAAFAKRLASRENQPPTLSELLFSDMTNTLMPYWLRSGDRGYMGIPLEVRAPFLDYRVVEFSYRLPITYLFRDGWHKWILRKAVEDILPADIVWRRQKMGFPFPFERFYAESEPIIGLIAANSRNHFIDVSKNDRSIRDWKILSFVLWYELFFNNNVALFEKISATARETARAEDCGYAPQFLTSWGIS
jgi:asparagine synthase (glutamine-hydrolysing)